MLKGVKIDIHNIAGIKAERTGKKENEVYEAMVSRTTLDSLEGVKLGLVHEVQQITIPEGASVLSIQK